MIDFVLMNLPRLLYIGFSLYSLVVIATRWQASRVMTMDKRFLLLFFIFNIVSTVVTGVLKIYIGVPPDFTVWLTVLTQSFMTAYLHYSIPPSFRRAHHRFTRRHMAVTKDRNPHG